MKLNSYQIRFEFEVIFWFLISSQKVNIFLIKVGYDFNTYRMLIITFV